MATSSYSNLFGTTGAGQQGSQAGIGTMFGQQPSAETEEERRRRLQGQQPQQGQTQAAPTQTFAQMQQAGQARPAPQAAQPAGQAQPAQQPPMMRQLQQQLTRAPGGQMVLESQQAAPAAQAPRPAAGAAQQAPQAPGGTQPPQQAYQSLLSQLQSQLQQQFQQPSGYTTPEFQQLRQAQVGNLEAEFAGQRQALDEELARRGLSASSIGAGRMGDLAGQQARAMAGLEAQLLQQQAEAGQRGRESALGILANVTGQLGTQALGEQEIGIKKSQLEQEAEQFGMTLNEQQAARMQQFGISTQELGLRAQQLMQEDRRLDITQAQNIAQNELETQRIQQQGQQFGLQLDEQKASRLQQLGISAQELALETQRIQNQATQFGQQLSAQEAQNLAQNELEQQRITNQATQFESERELRVGEMTGTMTVPGPNGTPMQVSTLAAQRLGQEGMALKLREAEQMSQQTGQVYEVDDEGNVVPKTINGQPVSTESALARLSRDELARAELTGSMMIDGVPVPTLAAQRLTQDQLNALRDQALRQSQTTGVMYRVNEAGTGVEVDLDENGNPVSTEQRRSQQAQELAQARQLVARQAEAMSQQTGLSYTVGDDGTVEPDMDTSVTPPVQRTTMQARELAQQSEMQARQLAQQRDLALAEMGGRIPEIDPATGQQRRDANGNLVFQETVQSRQLRQQYDMQIAELRGYLEVPNPANPNGPPIRVNTMAANQLDQQRLQNLAAQAAERSQLTGIMYGVGSNGQVTPLYDSDNRPIMTFGAQQSQQNLAFQLAQIFSASSDPTVQAQGRTVIQMLMQSMPGYAAMMGQNSPQTQTATPTEPIGTTGPDTNPPPYTPPPYNPPPNNPYNNPLGPTSGNEQFSYQPIDFGDILRFGENTYNPYGYY